MPLTSRYVDCVLTAGGPWLWSAPSSSRPPAWSTRQPAYSTCHSFSGSQASTGVAGNMIRNPSKLTQPVYPTNVCRLPDKLSG